MVMSNFLRALHPKWWKMFCNRNITICHITPGARTAPFSLAYKHWVGRTCQFAVKFSTSWSGNYRCRSQRRALRRGVNFDPKWSLCLTKRKILVQFYQQQCFVNVLCCALTALPPRTGAHLRVSSHRSNNSDICMFHQLHAWEHLAWKSHPIRLFDCGKFALPHASV